MLFLIVFLHTVIKIKLNTRRHNTLLIDFKLFLIRRNPHLIGCINLNKISSSNFHPTGLAGEVSYSRPEPITHPFRIITLVFFSPWLNLSGLLCVRLAALRGRGVNLLIYIYEFAQFALVWNNGSFQHNMECGGWISNGFPVSHHWALWMLSTRRRRAGKR